MKLKTVKERLERFGLEIKMDPTCWDFARILRVPFTRNIKVKGGNVNEKRCVLKQGNIEKQDFELSAPDKTLIKSHYLKAGQFPTPDKEEILSQCEFFKWLQTSPEKVHEPHMYAMLSISGHFPDNNATSYRLMSNFSSPSIDRSDKDQKIEQALTASGPRTCAGVDDVYGKCNKCPYFGKINSPILLKGDAHIGSEEMGFTIKGARGGNQRQYDDLLLAYDRDRHHKTVGVMKKTFIYTDTHYRITNDSEIKSFAQDKFIPKPNELECNEFKSLVSRTNYIHDGVFDFADNNGFINLQNGILNVETLELQEHSHEKDFTYCLNYNYNPDALCPTWDRFLDDVTLGRKCLQDILHEYLGYIISGSNYKFQKALILDGSGKNGKTTFLKILKALVGWTNCGTVSLMDLSKSVFASSGLHNKLCNISEEEPPESFKQQTGTFKNLTGDGTITAQYKYGDIFQFDNLAKLIISYNEMPYIGDTTTGMLRRLLVTPWEYDLEKEHKDKVDPDIEKKLINEIEGIFLKCLEGWKRLESQKGFTQSVHVTKRLDAIHTGSDAVKDFVENCEDVVQGDTDGNLSDIFLAFEQWNDTERNGKKISLSTFSRRLRRIGFDVQRVKVGGKHTRLVRRLQTCTPQY